MPRKYLKHFVALMLACTVVSSLVVYFTNNVRAAVVTWDGGGSDGTCGGAAGDGNKWSCGLNWSGDVAPGASDIATFNGTSTKNATIDSNISVAGIDINTGYTGIITQASGVTITVGTSDFDISAGTFTGGDSTLDFNDAFTVSGGTFTATTGNMQVAGAFTVSSGSFDPSSGTVIADTTSSTWDVVTTETFNNLTINRTSTLAISTGDTLVVAGTLTLTNGSVTTGTIDARSTIDQNNTFDGGNAILDFGDNAVAQTYTVNGGIAPNVRLDSSSDANDTIVLAANATFTSLTTTAAFSGAIPLTNGGDFTPTFTLWSQAAGTYDASAQSSWNIVGMTISGGTFTAPTLVTASGSSGTYDLNSTQTFNQFTVNRTSALAFGANDTLIVTGALILTDGSLGTSSAQIDARSSITQASTFDGGAAYVDFGDNSVAQTYTVNGGTTPHIRFNHANDANDLVSVAATASFSGLETTAGFSGAIPLSNPSNFTLTFTDWIQAAGSYDASAQSAWNIGGDMTLSGGTFTPPTLTSFTSVTGTLDVNSTQTFNQLTINRTSTFVLGANDTVVVTGLLTLTNGTIQTASAQIDARANVSQASTFDGGTSYIDFGDNAVAQTYTANGGVAPHIRFDHPSDADDNVNITAATSFAGIETTAGFSGALPLSNPSDFTLTMADWTLAGGTYDASAQSAWNFSGNITISGGTFTAPVLSTATSVTGTWDVNGTQTFNQLTMNRSSATTIGTGDTIIATGLLTLTNGILTSGTFEAQANVVVASTFDGGITTLNFGGSATQTFDLTGATGLYNGDIHVNKTGGQVNLLSALVMDAASQDLLIQEGKFNLAGFALTVNGSSGVMTVEDGGNFQLQGGETITLNASQPTLSTGSTVTYIGNGNAGANTYTITNLKSTYHHLAINSTDGATDVFQLGAALDVNGDLTLTAGTLDVVSGQNYAITLAGNWSNAGTFTARSGTVTLDGTSQTLSGSTTFYNLSKTVASAATLTLPASATQTITNTLTLQGASGQRLSLRSSIPASQANIDPQGSRSVQYLDVQDSNNTNLSVMNCTTGCFDSENNTNWNFPGVTISPISGNSTEAGGTATFTAVLNTQPTANVSFNLTSSDTTEGTVSPSSLTFTDVNWSTPQTVTITGVDDYLDDGNIDFSIETGIASSADPVYDLADPSDVVVTNTDNDTSGITVSALSGNTTEAGGAATFTVVLDAQPTFNVSIGISSNDTTEGTVSPSSLTFTDVNWSTPQTVTVTGVNDNLDDGNISYSIVTGAASSSDGLYSGINPSDVSVVNTDNDTSGFTVSAISNNTTEAGITANFTISLTAQPTASVSIGISSDDTTEGTVSAASLTFTTGNWAVPQSIIVTGVDDDIDDGNIAFNIITAAASSLDLNYDALNPANVAVTNADNDTLGVTVSAISGDTSETGATATFTVVLNTEPTDNVQVDSSSSDATEGVVTGGGSLTFTTVNWSTPQTVTVTGQDDFLADGDIDYTILVTTDDTNTLDAAYDAVDPSDVSVTNTDSEVSGVAVSAISGSTTEAGGTATFTVVLDAQPSGNVQIDTQSSDSTEGTVTSGSVLTFTTVNWDTPQMVTVTGVDDGVDDGDVGYSILVTTNDAGSADNSYDAIDPSDVAVTNVDNDTAAITVSTISGATTEAGGTATFTVVLNAQPTHDVSIGLSSSDATEGTISVASLTFTNANWDTPQTVTVTGVDDMLDDGNMGYSIVTAAAVSEDVLYNNVNPANVSVNNTDNDTAGATIVESAGDTAVAEEGATSDDFTLVLDSLPTATVTVSMTFDSDIVGSTGSLIFTTENWNVPQTVTVTAVDDSVDETDPHPGSVTFNFISDDTIFDSYSHAALGVAVADNDTTSVTVSAISNPTTEAGATATFTVVLGAQPTDDVTMTVATNDATEGVVTSSNSITFTSVNWSTPQTVTVTGQNDQIDDGNVAYDIVVGIITSNDGSFSGIDPADVSITNVDNDTAGITMTESDSTTVVDELGVATDTYTLVLASEPTEDVTITFGFDAAQIALGSPTFVFSSLNWNIPQTVTITPVDDSSDEDSPHLSEITHTVSSTDDVYDGFVLAGLTVSILDNDAASTGGGVNPTFVTAQNVDIDQISTDCTDSNRVILTLSARGAVRVYLSNTEAMLEVQMVDFNPDPVLSTVELAQMSVPWTLAGPSGEQTVYALFVSSTNNRPPLLPATIDLGSCTVPNTEAITPVPDSDLITIPGGFGISPFDGTTLEEIQVLSEGDVFKGEHFDTIYALISGQRRPFLDDATYFTWYTDYADVRTVSDATLTAYPIGAAMLPKPGSTLLQINSEPEVYISEGPNILHQIADEGTAQVLLGSAWQVFVFNLPPTIFMHYIIGDPVPSYAPWDMRHFFTRFGLHANDTDRDGLTEDEEAYYGTDPEVNDTDGDGVIDYTEVQNGSDPLVRE